MTLLLLLALAAPPDALPDSLPDALPDATLSGTPADAIATAGHIGATAVSHPPTPPAPAALRLSLWTTENSWCAACVPAHKLLDELYNEGWPCEWVEFDEHRATAEKAGIRAIPTWVVSRGGKETARLSGLQPKARIVEWLKASGVRQQQSAGDRIPGPMPAANAGVLPTGTGVQLPDAREECARIAETKAPTQDTSRLNRSATVPSAQGCAGGSCGTFRWRGR